SGTVQKITWRGEQKSPLRGSRKGQLHEFEVESDPIRTKKLVGDDTADAETESVFQRLGKDAGKADDLLAGNIAKREPVHHEWGNLNGPRPADALERRSVRLDPRRLESSRRSDEPTSCKPGIDEEEHRFGIVDLPPGDNEMIACHPDGHSRRVGVRGGCDIRGLRAFTEGQLAAGVIESEAETRKENSAEDAVYRQSTRCSGESSRRQKINRNI